MEQENTTEQISRRIEEGRISREIDLSVLLEENPSQDRMYGRLEAYLQTGVVIDTEDLKKVIDQYKFTQAQLSNLGLIARTGLMEGLIQEPDNVRHYGSRAGCIAAIALKCIEATRDKECKTVCPEEKNKS